jgi:predicted nucleic acid-binding protein
VEQVTLRDQFDARNIILSHADKDYSLADATSFAVMRRLGVRLAFTFDAHFTQFGFEVERV